MTFKTSRIVAAGLATATALTLASAVQAAPGMTGRADLQAATSSQTTEVRWRGRTAAAAGVGFAAGAVIGAAAASSANAGYHYGPSYGYYQPAPSHYGSYAYYGDSYAYAPAQRYGMTDPLKYRYPNDCTLSWDACSDSAR